MRPGAGAGVDATETEAGGAGTACGMGCWRLGVSILLSFFHALLSSICCFLDGKFEQNLVCVCGMFLYLPFSGSLIT